MTKILYNPENGAEINNLWIKDVFYLDSKKNEEFRPGMLLGFDDDIGIFIKNIYGFLIEVEPEDVKNYTAQKDKEYVCDQPGCDYKTTVRIGLEGHKRGHKKAIDPMVKVVIGMKKLDEGKKEINNQSLIDSEATNNGLVGEGLVEEGPKKIHKF